MYRKREREQLTIDDFVLPFGGKLLASNRWVKLAAMMPWDYIEDIYAESMCLDNGAPAISSRIAFGSNIIKENENLTDERTLEHIAENAYMQYFLGLREFTSELLFDPSMMTHFRKRFPADKVEEINKRIFAAEKKEQDDDDEDRPETPENKGKLVLDATAAPADIRYPSDLSLLNEARENTEKMIDELFARHGKSGRRTHYSRKKARSKYLAIAKQKKPGAAKKKAAKREQIGYIEGNMKIIVAILTETGMEGFPQKRLDRLLTIRELLAQQKEMLEKNTTRVDNRIVSLRQPHVRPIVRGKAGKKYEFGQKLAFSVVNGYTFIEKQSFDSFNEGITLIESAKAYRQRTGCWPEVIQADQIYRNKDNRNFCKEHGIRLSGPRLGRPGPDAERNRALELQDNCERNIIEGRNGMVKRRFGLDLIMAYLPETALTEAAINVLCMNAKIRILLRCLFASRSWQLTPREIYGFFRGPYITPNFF